MAIPDSSCIWDKRVSVLSVKMKCEKRQGRNLNKWKQTRRNVRQRMRNIDWMGTWATGEEGRNKKKKKKGI